MKRDAGESALFWIMVAAIGAAISLVLPFLFYSAAFGWDKPYVDEDCAATYACRDKLVYELVYAGIVIPHPLGDLTKEECERIKEDIQMATGALSELRCRPRVVARQES